MNTNANPFIYLPDSQAVSIKHIVAIRTAEFMDRDLKSHIRMIFDYNGYSDDEMLSIHYDFKNAEDRAAWMDKVLAEWKYYNQCQLDK